MRGLDQLAMILLRVGGYLLKMEMTVGLEL